MKAVARVVFERLGRKIGGKAVAVGDGFYDSLESQRVVRSGESVRITKIDLVLAETFFVVRTFRTYSHLFQSYAYFTAYIFTLIVRSHVHVPGIVVWNLRRRAVFIFIE